MANQKGRKPVTRKKKVEKDEGLTPYQDEITIVVTLVVCILLILSNFHMCGIFGVWVSHLFFGLFGFMNYIMPFGIFVGMAFYLSNRGSRKARRKMISTIALMVILMAILQLIYMPVEGGLNVSDYYAASSESRKGGGMVGGLIGGMLSYLFDDVAAIIILIAIGLVLCMFITEKLFFAPMGKKSYQKMQKMKEQRRIQRAEYERQAEEREAARAAERNAIRNQKAEKRKAKTFTIEKEVPPEVGQGIGNDSVQEYVDKNSAIQNGVIQNSVIQNVKADKLKRRERKKVSVDMEEITPTGIEHMHIERADTPKDTGSIPIYEEEMMQKFNPVNAEMKTDLSEMKNVYNDVMEEEDKKHSNNPLQKIANLKSKKDSSGASDYVAKAEVKTLEEAAAEQVLAVDVEPEIFIERERGNTEAEQMMSSESDDLFVAKTSGNASEEVSNYDPIEQEEDMGSVEMLHALEDAAGHKKSSKTSEHKTAVEKKETYKAESDGKGADSQSLDMAIQAEEVIEKPYQFPTLDLLAKPSGTGVAVSDEELKQTAMKLHNTLESFGVKVTINNVSCGPTVTRYELHPEQGVKVSKITGLADDIKLNLAAADIRIEAPIPGKAAVGIEVPNKQNSAVMLRELLESKDFEKHSSNIAFAVGKDIAGKTVVTDIAKMPHLLIAGATGSGKSVCINTLIMSILYKSNPNDVKLIMIDPKVVELSVYNGIPHLLIPVVTDPKKASAALNWAVMEMTERYNKFAEIGVRNLKGYNEKVAQVADLEDEKYKKMPEIVIIVDELADLMMVAPGEVEDAICRLAQLARAAGIHLVIATQRPSVNVITGVIKANIPSRIAFSVSSAVDSRTILDGGGAEKLLGKGDMLFYPSGYQKPVRVQGAFVSDDEVSAVVEFLTQDTITSYDNSIVDQISSQASKSGASSGPANDRDEYFVEAAKFIVEKDKASIGMLQRVFKIGFNRASRLMEQLYEAGVVGADEGTKPRKVLMSMEQLEEYIDEYV